MCRPSLAIFALFVVTPAWSAEPPKVADLVRQLDSGTIGERAIAAERLGDLGAAAADAVPALTRVARAARGESKEGDFENQRANRLLYAAALDALAGIGSKSAVALAELLPDEKDENFGHIPWHFASLGRNAAPAVPALAKLLADDDQDFRVRVALILEKIGPGAELAVPHLIDLFLNPKNKDAGRFWSGPMPPPPRVAAVRVLIRIGPKAAQAITDNVLPRLEEELRTGDHRAGGSPMEVLSVLGEKGETLVPAVIAVIRKGEGGLDREEGGETLLGLGATGRKAFGELLAGPDVEVRRAMVAALRRYFVHERYPRYYRFDPAPLDLAPFVPALVAELKNVEPSDRLKAARELRALGEKAPRDVVDKVAALFCDPEIKKLAEEDGALLAEPWLTDFGERGVRALIPLLDSDSPAIRKIAAGQIDYAPRSRSADALPPLRKLTEDANADLAMCAAYSAAKLSLDPKDAAPLVSRRFVQHADPKVRAWAATYIRILGPLGVPHHEALIPLLDDKDEEVVQAAAEAIYYHAPKGSAAARALVERKFVKDKTLRFVRDANAPPEPSPPGVPELIKALGAGDDDDRVKAALDLGDRGAAAKGAAPALKKLLSDPDPDLRFAAAYALARIENDPPALRKLLTAGLERGARGRRTTYAVAWAFERLPPDFSDVIPIVARWLERERDNTVLLSGLLKYGPKAKDAVPALRKVLRGPGVVVHGYMATEMQPACEVLGAIGPDARDALPELRQKLDFANVETALAAREAIRKIEAKK